MPRLTPSELVTRLALDYRAVMGLSRESLGAVRAMSSLGAPAREVGAAEGEAGRAGAYIIEYRFPHLVGLGRTASSATAAFDLNAGGNYPFSEPAVAFLSQPRPWSPHVHPASGIVCLGYGWKNASGRMLLAQLVVHAARLLNFDEPGADTSADHWNASAVHYWRSKLAGGPYRRDLTYPRLPSDITHGVADASTVFRAAGISGTARIEDGEDGMFRPVGGGP